MFSLAYPLTQTVDIDGTTYPIDMSFDNILRLIDMLNDDELSDDIQVVTGVRMLIGDVDFDLEIQAKVLNNLFEKLIAKGAEKEQAYDIAGNPMPSINAKSKDELYSLVEDAEYIYASFMQDYGMDLFEHQGKLHWDKFRALLSGLRDDTKFKKVLEIRQMELPTGKGTEKQRKAIIEAKKEYALKGQSIEEDESS